MEHVDVIVAGSGIAGLTAARLLAMRGARVVILEQAPRPGGLLARFSRRGVPFDVGFHFTGGFLPGGDGILDGMLRALGVREAITPIHYPATDCHHIIVPGLGLRYVVPSGLPALEAKLCRDFPADGAGIGEFFARFRRVVDLTPTLRIDGFDQPPPILDEDEVTLQAVLDQTVRAPLAQTILSGFCMCHGSRPDEISFANHCRMAHGLHHSLARVENGGQAFVDALLAALAMPTVSIRCGTAIAALEEVQARRVRRFRLTDGTALSADLCLLTQHPQHILALLQTARVSPAFQERVAGFELSPGFFSLYGVMRQGGNDGPGPAPIVSILPEFDLNRMMTARTASAVDGPVLLLRNREETARGPVEAATILEVSFAEWMAPWAESRPGHRPPGYGCYKAERTASILRRLTACLPDFGERFELFGSSSMLTYRDALALPGGAAYGIKQKLGQFNLAGRLPFANLYALGQCAILPGVIGAMTSAFLLCRNLIGKEDFRDLVDKG